MWSGVEKPETLRRTPQKSQHWIKHVTTKVKIRQITRKVLIVMTDKTGQSAPEAHQVFLQDIQRNIRRILSENYKMKKIFIEYIAAGAARLSNPIKITGLNEKGEKIRYFGKVIGSKDILSVRYIQFLKNIYLQMNTQQQIFEMYRR